MTVLVTVSIGLSLFGVTGALVALAGFIARRFLPRRRAPIELRPILVTLLVELRSGRSVLSSLQTVAARFPDFTELRRSVRLAAVSGLPAAVDESRGLLRALLAHLARAQASGGSAADAVRRMLESDIARQRADRLARTRSLPVRLMFPVTLLILPGVVLLTYGPTILSLLDGLVAPLD